MAFNVLLWHQLYVTREVNEDLWMYGIGRGQGHRRFLKERGPVRANAKLQNPRCAAPKKNDTYTCTRAEARRGEAMHAPAMDCIHAAVTRAVHNTVGHLSERIVQNAIAGELRRLGIDVQEQVTIPVFNGTRIVGYNRIDMVLYLEHGPVVLELKRLRQSLHQSPASARLRILGQARAYGHCLARLSDARTAPPCFVVNVFPGERGENVEIVPASRAPCAGPRKHVQSRAGRVLRRPNFYSA